MSYIIGSFNVMGLNNTTRDLSRIAQIIKEEKFDIVALQEALVPKTVEEYLVRELGPTYWKGKHVTPPSVSNYAAKGYAYLWNSTRVCPVYSEDNFTTLDRYQIRNNIDKNHMIRPPMYARFQPLHGPNFEFRLINTHIISEKPECLIDNENKNYLRVQEFETLAKQIYPRSEDKRYGDNRPSYTFIMGDYNLCLVTSAPRINEDYPIGSIDTNSRYLHTVQNERR